MTGYPIAGVRELLALHPVPIHVQADEAEWVKRVTEAADSDLVEHRSGDDGPRRRHPHRAHPHARSHPRQPVLPRRRPVGGRRHPVPRGLRSHRPPRWRLRGALREHHPEAGQGPRRRRPLPGSPVLARAVGLDGRHPGAKLRLPAPRADEWVRIFEAETQGAGDSVVSGGAVVAGASSPPPSAGTVVGGGSGGSSRRAITTSRLARAWNSGLFSAIGMSGCR